MPTATAVQGYFSIPVNHIEESTVVEFDIFLPRADGSVVLYREKNLVFTPESRRKLEENGVSELLVSEKQFASYRAYRIAQGAAPEGAIEPGREVTLSGDERDLGELLSDTQRSVESRAALLLGVSHQVIESALRDLGSPGLAQRVFRVAESTTRFLLHEPNAFSRLVKMLGVDFDAYSHAMNVSLYSTQLALAAGVNDPHEAGLIGRAAMIHDVGKGDIPSEILHSSKELGDLEWAEVMSHVDRGVARLRESGWDDPTTLDVAANHHERADGSGYPRGLQLQRLSLASRIVAIADTFDALTSAYPSRPAQSGFQALWGMKRDMVGYFDSGLLDKFIDIMVEPRTRRR